MKKIIVTIVLLILLLFSMWAILEGRENKSSAWEEIAKEYPLSVAGGNVVSINGIYNPEFIQYSPNKNGGIK